MDHKPLQELCALVDGEKIDLNDYDKRLRLVKRSLSRCNSNQTLPDSRRDHGHATSWKKLANNLYKPIPSYSIYKTYPKDRLKQSRATSADPRFRQERKSSSNLIGQSDVNLNQASPRIKLSTSKLNNRQIKHDNADVDLSHRVISKNRIATRKSRTFIDDLERQRISREPPAAYQSSLPSKDLPDVSCYGSTHSAQNHNLDNEEVLERAVETVVEFESLQENFISSLQQDKEQLTTLTPKTQNDWQTTTVNTDDELKTNNPDWSTIEVYRSENVNPQLIRHCPVIKSKHLLKKSTSSWTMPVVKHKLPPGVCVCQKCDRSPRENSQRAAKTRTKSYLYDNYSDVTSGRSKFMQMQRDMKMGVLQKLWAQFLQNYYILVCFIFGSFVGLVLVASVIWLLSDDHLWSIVTKKESRRANPVRAVIMSVGSALNYAVSAFFGTVYQTIMLPRNAVYATKDEPTLRELLMSFI